MDNNTDNNTFRNRRTSTMNEPAPLEEKDVFIETNDPKILTKKNIMLLS